MSPRDDRRTARIAPDPYHRQGVERVTMGPHVVRFLLDRSSDSSGRDEPSQDYLIVQNTPDGLCFAVTDGVGSSFLGELAAQLLAACLVDLLSRLKSVPEPDQLADHLTQALRRLSDEVRQEILSYPIPTHVPSVLQSVLAEQREYGSEAMFACGRIDVVRDRPTRVGLAWLGDTHLRVLTDAGPQSLTGRTTERWSTDRGPRGTVHVWVDDARAVRRILACTDGLLPEIAAAGSLSDASLDRRLSALAQRADSDDMALVDVALSVDAMPPAHGGDPSADAVAGTTLEDGVESAPARHGRPPARSGRGSAAAEPGPEQPVPGERSRQERATDDSGPDDSGPDDSGPDDSGPGEPRPAAGGAGTPGAPQPGTGLSGADESTAPAGPGAPRWRPRSDRGALHWLPVPEAKEYTLEFDDDPGFSDPITYRTSRTEFAPPPLGPRCWVRVRGHTSGRDGPWSEPLELGEGEPIGPARRRPVIRVVRVDERRGRVDLEWDAIPVRDSHILRLELVQHPDRARQLRVVGRTVTLMLPPGDYRFSVRGDRREDADDWSDRVEVRVR